MNWFKAHTTEERSGDILVPFDARWLKAFQNANVQYVFRKRVPTSFVPRTMFIYISSPNKILVGNAPIKNVFHIRPSEGKQYLKGAHLTEQELREYASGYEQIGVYQIGDVVFFNKPITLEVLAQKTGFVPPQSFVSLSKKATEFLNQKSGSTNA